MSETFLVSDTHFGHGNICRFKRDDGTDLRPWDDVFEMEEALIERWNSAVSPSDKVYHLGDVAIPRRGLKVLERLNGRKILIRGNHDCLDETTEILTNSGWKNCQEISVGDYCWSIGDGRTGEWMPVTDVIKKTYQGKMVSLETGRVSMLVTPNHRIAFMKNDEMNYFLANELISGKSGSVPEILTASFSSFEGLTISDDLLCLLAWILTDGHIVKRGLYREIQIYQSKPSGIHRIETLLKKCEAVYSVVSRGCKKKGETVCGRRLKKDSLESFVFKIKGDLVKKILAILEDSKQIPESFLKMTTEQTRIFVRELMEGDGSWAKSHNSGGLHGQLPFLESVMTLCVTHGINASISPVMNRNCYVLNLNFSKTSKIFQRANAIKQGKLREVDYDGIVWCICTPYTNFLARRNGKPFFTGNCFKLSDYTDYFRDVRGCHYLDRCILTHIPVHPVNLTRYAANIHGHLHYRTVPDEKTGLPDLRYYNVCVEHINYTPISWNVVRKQLQDLGIM